MKIILTILVLLFLFVSVFLGYAILKNFVFNNSDSNPDELETVVEESIETIQESTESIDTETTEDDSATTETVSQITSGETLETMIKFYLDGEQDSGIFLGEAEYGVESPEALKLFGSQYTNSGFFLEWPKGDYVFEPGSLHYLYMYGETPDEGEIFIRKAIKIPGEPPSAGDIMMNIEFPKETTIDATKELSFSGWAVDRNSSNGTNIDRIEFYLDGPAGFGKMLGTADYGSEREDVAQSLDNNNLLNCGFRFKTDIGNFKPASTHSIYIYTISLSGQSHLTIKDIKIKGESKSFDSNITINCNLEENAASDSVKISGWLVNINYKVNKIIFVSDININEDIYSMNLDGSELTQLTDSPGADLYPAVSTDGKKIIYSSDINGVWQIMVMDWDGKNKKQLTFNSERNGDPSWSFDDKFIYFERFFEENWELYKMDADGSDVTRLTFNSITDDWHPFGDSTQHKILFESGVSGSFDIFIMNDDGTDVKRLSDQVFQKRVPSMSSDGRYIVFQGKASGDKNYNIYIMDADGKNLKNLTKSSTFNGHALISPDSKYIVFEKTVDGNKKIYLMNLDGSNSHSVSSNDNYATYMPDFIYIK